jgi:uncharacterized protein YcbX
VIVEQLWRYPFKSMQGEQVDAVSLTARGVVGDRAWAARDEVRGGIRGAKKIGGLMKLAARSDPNGGAPTITLPDGREVAADAEQAAALVSDAVGHPVTLWPHQDDPAHYRRGAPDSPDAKTELRSILGLEDTEPLPDLSIFAQHPTPPGTYVDAFPLLLMTTSSLAALQALLPGSAIDVRRFRPNVVVSGASDGFAEAAWTGRTARLGGATLRFVAGCPRCVMITRPFAELPEDRSIMRTLVRETAQVLGMYTAVDEPGDVRLGDELVLD